jgi:hypothetical protein
LGANAVDVDPHALLRMHPPQLRLLEIRSHPKIVRLHDQCDFLTRGQPLSNFRRAFRDDSRHGARNLAIGKIELGLIHLSLCRECAGLPSDDVCLADRNLSRGILPNLFGALLSLGKLCPPLIDLTPGRRGARPVCFHRRG